MAQRRDGKGRLGEDPPVKPDGELLGADEQDAAWRQLAKSFFDIDIDQVDLDENFLWNVTTRPMPPMQAGEMGLFDVKTIDRTRKYFFEPVYLFIESDGQGVYRTSMDAVRGYFASRYWWQDNDCYVMDEYMLTCLVFTHGRWDGKICSCKLERLT